MQSPRAGKEEPIPGRTACRRFALVCHRSALALLCEQCGMRTTPNRDATRNLQVGSDGVLGRRCLLLLPRQVRRNGDLQKLGLAGLLLATRAVVTSKWFAIGAHGFGAAAGTTEGLAFDDNADGQQDDGQGKDQAAKQDRGHAISLLVIFSRGNGR